MVNFLSEIKDNAYSGSSLESTVYNTLKEGILTLAIAPGEKISEMRIAKAMDCSRSPVRDAFRQLQHQGFLEIRPQVGTFVPLIDLDKVEESRFIRESIEIAVLKHGMRTRSFVNYFDYLQDMVDRQADYYLNQEFLEFNKLDKMFHDFFCSGINKPFVKKYQGIDSVHYSRLKFVAIRYDPHPQITIEQHQNIINAIKAEDEKAMEKAVSIHLSNVYRVVRLCKNEVRHFLKEDFEETLEKLYTENIINYQ